MAELVTGLSAGAAYALMAVGIVLIFKGTRALSFAQGEIGAFGLFLGLRWSAHGIPFVGWHLPVPLTLLVVPAAFSYIDRFRLWSKEKLSKLVGNQGANGKAVSFDDVPVHQERPSV